MLEDLDEDDAKKLKYLAIFGVGLVLILLVLLYSLDFLGGNMKKKGKPAQSDSAQRRDEPY